MFSDWWEEQIRLAVEKTKKETAQDIYNYLKQSGVLNVAPDTIKCFLKKIMRWRMNYEKKVKHKIFNDEPELTLVEVESSDNTFSVGEFINHCLSSFFIDYDGFGHFIKTVNGKRYALIDIHFSIDEDEVYYKKESIGSIFYVCNRLDLKEIVWFNR